MAAPLDQETNAAAAAAAVVSWTDLPACLTEKILERLTVFDYVRFGAVCRRWRSIERDRRLRYAPSPPPMLSLPCFIPDRPDEESVPCSVGVLADDQPPRTLAIPLSPWYLKFLESSEDDDYEVDPDSSSLPHGWVLLDDWHSQGRYSSYRDAFRLTLLNPITGVQIQLPPLAGMYCEYKATMSPPPTCTVLAVTTDKWDSKLHMYRQGDPQWTYLKFNHRGLIHGLPMPLMNMTHHEGKFYCMWMSKGLMVIDPAKDNPYGHFLEMDQSQLPTLSFSWEDHVADRLEVFLLESCGKMLLACKFCDCEYDESSRHPVTRTFMEFHLFEADLVNRKWVKMESIGNRALFVYRGHAASLLAADVGVKPNCVYTLDPPRYQEEPMPWKVLDLATGEMADVASLPCPPLPSEHLMFVPNIY